MFLILLALRIVDIKFILLKPFARCQRESQRYARNDVLFCSTW